MRFIRATWAVFAFECRRAMRWSRVLVTLGLALFPLAILWLIRHEGGLQTERSEAWSIALFVLVPELVCLLAVLLWVTPLVQAEVEGKTWPYLVVRPAGKAPVLLGKYAAGVFWSMLTALLALTLTLGTLWPTEQALHAWCVLAGLVALSCNAYGALFALLGIVFLRRGMVFAVAYTVLEFGVRFIPAVVKQFTVQYHLQSLLVHWMNLNTGERHTQKIIETLFGVEPSWRHVAILVGYAVILPAVAAVILRYRELVAATETAT